MSYEAQLMAEAGVFGGECPNCGDNVDYCSCTPCDRGSCDHKGHCDNCRRGYSTQAEAEDGLCMNCQIEWAARHQLPAPAAVKPGNNLSTTTTG